MANVSELDDFMAMKALWWYRHIFDTDGSGHVTHKDYTRSAMKYAIWYCKGDRQVDVWKMVFDAFNGIWAEIKGSPATGDTDVLRFEEWKNYLLNLGTSAKKFDDLSVGMQRLIDLLFESYDAFNDNAVDENEYRLYLCARSMDMKRAAECFLTLTGGQKAAKIKRPQFRDLMFDYLTSWDSNSKGKYICGPYDSAKRTTLEKYLLKSKA